VFGSLVKVCLADGIEVYGLIYDVRMDDDPFVRQLAASAEDLRPEYIEDQRRHRQVPIEVSVLVAGFRNGSQIHRRLPPQPPLSLDVMLPCSDDELVEFTSGLDYLGTVLATPDLPTDELLASHLRYAALARGDDGGDFLLRAGRELARLLTMDLLRLEALLRRMRS
jgi:hypothetical protein